MTSAAEQFASNINFSSFAKAEELKKRLLFTLGALIVYRLGTFVPIPGVDPEAFARGFQSQQGGLLGTLNIFAGGAVERMALFALNIMPYISASIIMQLMSAVIPSLEKIKKEGEQGRRQINQYTRYLTVFLATMQGYFIAVSLQSTAGTVINPGPFFLFTTTITLVGGVMFLLWLGEQITARGVGNGVSLIIFAGIIAELPRAIAALLDQGRAGGGVGGGAILIIAALALSLIAFVVFMERSQRRILVQYPRRQVGQRMTQGEKSHLPLKLNVSGVIPPIFASSLLLLPATAAGAVGEGSPEWLQNLTFLFAPGRPSYIALYAALIIGFTFVYTSVVFNVEEVADNLKKYGGFVQGYRPGARTAEYLDYVLTRLTVLGAMYLTFVCILPEILKASYSQTIPVYIGGTSLLIVVSVTLDTVGQIQGHLLAQQYESLIKKSKLRGGRR
ncbi:preprotein translocase subunit SecY [Hyphococcus luteus]|uniref:Protein translocase subunit SecY n=1 Tax=Hyphococcus luteus TaxID=2058213 RepID=A0A2S7JYT3_9PROT|nr:preprotein translocase subunit SecY [Marinicaulis flavus]PQA85414.1 preprotein translocase subunit SecY [Marinicaulis flavus]